MFLRGEPVKHFWTHFKFSRRYGRALSLKKKNQLKEAYTVASEALSMLENLGSQDHLVLSNSVIIVEFMDDIAVRLGTPQLTATAIGKVLEQCRVAGFESAILKEHIDWLRHRSHEQNTSTT